MNELALITPTSDRHAAFALCERWMGRAINLYGRNVNWYVIDDGREPVQCNLGQIHIRRPPGKDRLASFIGNLMAGLEMACESRILFIEDDDWYAPNYLASYAERLEHSDIIGEARVKSYSPLQRRYWTWDNAAHASLCQTGIRQKIVPEFLAKLRNVGTPWTDVALWEMASRRGYRRSLEPHSMLCVGMKGLPGTRGFSEGHNRNRLLGSEDPRGDILRSWIGQDDAAIYLEMSRDEHVPHNEFAAAVAE